MYHWVFEEKGADWPDVTFSTNMFLEILGCTPVWTPPCFDSQYTYYIGNTDLVVTIGCVAHGNCNLQATTDIPASINAATTYTPAVVLQDSTYDTKYSITDSGLFTFSTTDISKVGTYTITVKHTSVEISTKPANQWWFINQPDYGFDKF